MTKELKELGLPVGHRRIGRLMRANSIAVKAFDSDWLLQDLDVRGATAVIPPKANRKLQRNYDMDVYKW